MCDPGMEIMLAAYLLYWSCRDDCSLLTKGALRSSEEDDIFNYYKLKFIRGLL